MNKNLTEIVFILDRSGSMSGLESDTIGGFNAMIEKQKKAPGEALVSTILFDNVSEVIHDRVNIRDIKPMTDREYCVRGCTALLDAIGGAIHHIGNVHKYAREEDVEMSRNVQSGNTQNLKSMVIQRSFPKWSVAERRKTAAASDQAACCACAHSRYFAGGSPSGLRV